MNPFGYQVRLIVGTVLFALAALAALMLVTPARADEGMWLFTNPSRAQLEKDHDFTVTDAWLEHIQKSSVKMGASGSFVSADGLLLTNHHVGRGPLQQLSTPEHNYARDGFMAHTLAEELRVPNMSVDVLQSIEDVTSAVNQSVPPDATGEAAALARRGVFARLESASKEATGMKSEVVTLYQGGQYHLYRYKTYTDVRLVFAPESAIAAFGGDADNFEYPRYCLDVCFFRAYENDRPAHVADYLKWASAPLAESDLVFVAGHPGSTDRLLTLAQWEFMRDVTVPFTLEGHYRNEVALVNWGARSAENQRRADRHLLSIQNSRKAYDGRLLALQDPAFHQQKREAEQTFRDELAKADDRQALGAFDRIARAQQEIARLYVRHALLEGASGFASQSFTLARDLLRAGDERPKPNGTRLPAYTDAKRESFERGLFSPAPIYEDVEILRLTTSLTWLVQKLGAEDPVVTAALADQAPADRARAVILGTKVRDVAFRHQLYEGGAEAVRAAHDPLIELARAIDPESRQLQTAVEAQRELIKQAQADLSRARFALHGTTQYPDATGTLRLSYGTVRGYRQGEENVPALSTFAGLFARYDEHAGKPPFDLPKRWVERRAQVNLTTPFNFVSTCDIIGGNSGSPMLNRAGEFAGIVFDGNLASLSGNLGYDDRQNRAIGVHAAAIIEALQQVYEAEALVGELLRGGRPVGPPGFTTTASGLSYQITRHGAGPSPEPGQVVILHYVGTLDDGTVFDSSRNRNQPFAFTFGKKQVIMGYEEGFGLLHVGDRATLIIPPELAYGPKTRAKIPAHSTLHFDVELLELKDHGLADLIGETMEASGLEAARTRFAEMKAKGFAGVYVSEAQMDGLGYKFLGKGKLPEAVAILQWNAELHPASANVYDSLGDAELKLGRRDEAKAHYQKSLELDPKNTNAAKVLAEWDATSKPGANQP